MTPDQQETQETTEQRDTHSPDSSTESTKQTVPPEPMHQYRFKKGDKIAGQFEVVKPLGFGGFAEVYHCREIELRRDRAVKVLTEKGVGLKEARTAARMKHPGIVYVHRVLTPEDDMPVIVFDYIEGQTLEERLNKAQYRRLPLEEETLSVIQQLSEALDYAHGEGVIHRDIKPSNIILDRQGNAHLTDFGLAGVKRRAAKEPGKSMLSGQQGLSGTIPYMAPEQLKEENPGDELSDLYSFGVVVYEMLTGQLPYRGRGPSLIFQIGTGEPTPPTLANPELPKGIEPVLLRALNKNPEKRYSSCVELAQELAKTAKDYVTASDQYKQAQALFKAEKWRQALSAFEAVPSDFRDTVHCLEQTRHQIKLLELYEKAQKALEQGQYQDTLDTLKVLTELDPDYAVANLREQARKGLAQEKRRSLDQQYQQATRQFESEEYQSCLDTLAVIREQDPNYSDPNGIETPARERVQRQRELRALYAQGVDQIAQEQWEEACATFQQLQDKALGYEDVETRLAMARHMARMSSFLQTAMGLLKQESFAACVDKLDELQSIDADYKKTEIAQLRQEAFNQLHGQAHRLIEENQFEESLAALAELRERSPDHPGVEELEAQAREGIRVRDLRARLEEMYRQALAHLNQRAFAEALEVWQAIREEKADLDYPDQWDVEGRAREGLCMSLYNEALGALAQNSPGQALELWQQVRDVDPNYPDNQRVEERAHAMMERKEKVRWWTLRLGGGAVALIALIVLLVASKRCAFPSATSTPTWTLSPEPTLPTPSLTSTLPPPSPTPSATPTPTTTPAPSPTYSPDNVALATTSSGIFAAPNAESQTLGGVSEGEEVLILGRSAYGEWFYIRNDQGVEGFVYAPRFDWSGDYESLPVKASSAPVPTSTPSPGTSNGSLEIDVWHIPSTGKCEGGGWHMSIYIQGRGGDGVYTYYWNGEKVGGPLTTDYTFEVDSVGKTIVGTAKVVSGDGQAVEKSLLIPAPDCAQ